MLRAVYHGSRGLRALQELTAVQDNR
jgi:hypothetical protein